MDKEELQRNMEQSEEEFRKQFDPNSNTHHGGSNVPVPLYGEKIPESMPNMFPEGFDPNQAQEVIDYGEEYRKIEEERNIFQNLKKSLAKLGPVVQAFLRHEEAFKQKGDPNNEAHLKIHEENIQKEKLTLKAVNSELEEYLPKLDAMGEEGRVMAKELSEIINDSTKKYETKESLTNFNFKQKKLSSQTFSYSQKWLQKLKDIKKQYAQKKKEEEAGKA